MFSTLSGHPVSPLGLGAHPEQPAACVGRAIAAGINYLFFYGLEHADFVAGLRQNLAPRRQDLIIASGSESRDPDDLRTDRDDLLSELGIEVLDLFFLEYINPGNDDETIFGPGGLLDELTHWKSAGLIRFAGASAHDRNLAARLARDPRVDVLMYRFNMAHRKAAKEVFPAAIETQTPVVGFTATRWGTLLDPPRDWPAPPATAADCYRYSLAQPAIHIVLTAPKSIAELEENLSVLRLPAMSAEECRRWESYGELVYRYGKRTKEFETRWP